MIPRMFALACLLATGSVGAQSVTYQGNADIIVGTDGSVYQRQGNNFVDNEGWVLKPSGNGTYRVTPLHQGHIHPHTAVPNAPMYTNPPMNVDVQGLQSEVPNPFLWKK